MTVIRKWIQITDITIFYLRKEKKRKERTFGLLIIHYQFKSLNE